jgi:hypothetical protein
MLNETPDLRLGSVAQGQADAFSRAQAIAAGFPVKVINHRLASKHWRPLQTTVYCAQITAVTPATLARAALLAVGDYAMFSHSPGRAFSVSTRGYPATSCGSRSRTARTCLVCWALYPPGRVICLPRCGRTAYR